MASQTSAAETSGANASAASNLHYAIQVDSVEEFFVKELLDRNWKNEELFRLLDSYFDHTLKTINFHDAVVQEYLRSAHNYQSLIFHDGEEGNFNHHHFFHNLASVYTHQLRMQDTLQSFLNDLARKLHRVKFWMKVFAVSFTAAVVITSAAAAATARKPVTAAVAAAAPILLGTIGRWTLSHLREYKDGVKKHVEITGVMAVGTKITMNHLSRLHLSARRFEFLTKWVSEMAESGVDADDEVRTKLMESFQELQGKAADFSRDIRLARELTVQSVIKHLDFITW